jgi:FkbM family methyltransferase
VNVVQVLALARRFFSLPAEDRPYFLRRFVDLNLYKRSGFSQFGEDANVASYLRALGRSCRSYIDIGANDPVSHSNTYLFYRDGGSGTLVEANPEIARRIRRKRPRDTVVNVAVVPEGSGEMDLHVMDLDGLSTVSSQWRDAIARQEAASTVKILPVRTVGINDLLMANVGSKQIDFASLDIEGLDYDVLSAWDFDRWRPYLFCGETAEISISGYVRNERIGGLMNDRGYRPLFNTFANTIFVDGRV